MLKGVLFHTSFSATSNLIYLFLGFHLESSLLKLALYELTYFLIKITHFISFEGNYIIFSVFLSANYGLIKSELYFQGQLLNFLCY